MKENLFEDITLEDAKAKLQAATEYLKRVVRDEAAKFAPEDKYLMDEKSMKIASDVLEIIYYSPRKNTSEDLKELCVTITADTSQLDEAIEKAKELENILSRLTVDIEVER